jgi:hypothetical protein
MTSHELVKKYHKADQRILRMKRQLKTGEVRGNAATDRAIQRHETAKDEAVAEILATVPEGRALVGALVAERDLMNRLAESDVERPDLLTRRRAATRTIKRIATGG